MENEEERAGYSNPELQLAYAHVCSCIGMTLRHPLVWFMDWTHSTQKHFVPFCHCSCIITLYYYYCFYLSMYFKQHAGGAGDGCDAVAAKIASFWIPHSPPQLSHQILCFYLFCFRQDSILNKEVSISASTACEAKLRVNSFTDFVYCQWFN